MIAIRIIQSQWNEKIQLFQLSTTWAGAQQKIQKYYWWSKNSNAVPEKKTNL